MVDGVQNEQEVLVKGLGNQLSRVRNIAGSTVLGNGEIALILNVQDLMKFSASVKIQAKEEKEIGKKTSILIADDSVTARTLLKNILESAGYEVKTVVDGMEAFTTLKIKKFDLLVSDVEMPRMNGFSLVSKIRNDSELKDLPVILITGLESREDKEKGIEVGANAYIVKSSFDQSDLLEVIRRFI
jgi:two-component system chemotaxis sensor kinase CheA